MTDYDAKIRMAIERHPSKSNSAIGHGLTPKVKAAEVERVRNKMVLRKTGLGVTQPALVEIEPQHTPGFKLSGCRVMSRRPAETAAKYIRRLPDGKGYLVSDLSKEWGMAEETIRRYAKELGCMRYVEVEQDEWKQLVISPNTAAKFPQ